MLVPGSVKTSAGSIVSGGNAVRIIVGVFQLTDPVIVIAYNTTISNTTLISSTVGSSATVLYHYIIIINFHKMS